MRRLKIAFVSPEAKPFASTGLLGDVSYALPRALAQAGHEVVLIIPMYHWIDRERFNCVPFYGALGVPLGDAEKWARLYTSAAIPGVRTVFIEHDTYFGRDGLYGYGDDAERFTFFCRASLQSCMALGFDPDIIHCNDWQSALIPIYIKSLYRLARFFKKTKTIMTVHDVEYQGIFDRHEIRWSHLGWEAYNEECLKYYDSINFLKGGLFWSDALTTASRGYARELQTPDVGHELAGIFSQRSNRFTGILHGVDYGDYDSAAGTEIPVAFSADKPAGKVLCKENLQNVSGLNVNPRIPLIAAVADQTSRKGMDILASTLGSLAEHSSFQCAVVGKGDPSVMTMWANLQGMYPDRVALFPDFSDAVMRRVLAAADIFAEPARSEPSGLVAMYALAYGAVPVVRAAGALPEIVIPWNAEKKTGNGFIFDNPRCDTLSGFISSALDLYRNQDDWGLIRCNAISSRFTWSDTVTSYEKVYETILPSVSDI